MPLVAKQNATSGLCHSCHQTGKGAAICAADDELTVERSGRRSFVLELALGSADETGVSVRPRSAR